MHIIQNFRYIRIVFLHYPRILFYHISSFLFAHYNLVHYIFGHTLLPFCIRLLVIRRNMVQYAQLKLRDDGTKPKRTANKAILLSECSGKILDISKAKMIPLDLRETKIYNLKATLRNFFYRKRFKYFNLTKQKFYVNLIIFESTMII